MTESKNKSSKPFFSNVIGVAKKLSRATDYEQKRPLQAATASTPVEMQQLLRGHLPQISKQILGRHYQHLSQLTHLVAPTMSDRVSDYLFEQLNTFTHHISSVDAILDEAGAQELEELTQDVNRSRRLSQALAEQNKWIASVQGAFTGATGVIGVAIDVPASIVLSLRTIYQVGRAYGFELNKEHELDIVQFIFRQIDLNLIAEKQAVLMTVKTISNLLHAQDLEKIQQLLGNQQDLAIIKQYLEQLGQHHQLQGLQYLSQLMSQFSVLNKCTPILSAYLSAAYSWRLAEDVNTKAQVIFSQAREYLQQHHEFHLSPIAAYEKSRELLTKKATKDPEAIAAAEKQQHLTVLAAAVEQTADTRNNVFAHTIKFLLPHHSLQKPPHLMKLVR